MRQIDAEKYFSQANYVKAYEIIKKILDDDSYYSLVVPLYFTKTAEIGNGLRSPDRDEKSRRTLLFSPQASYG